MNGQIENEWSRKEMAQIVKQSISKVRPYDELLADEIINNLADYELCWRRETGIWK